jgi:hypothetical protein
VQEVLRWTLSQATPLIEHHLAGSPTRRARAPR